MTNEQTFVFLKALRSSIAAAIDEADNLAPVEAQTLRRRHKATTLPCLFCTEEIRPTHYEDRLVAEWLDPLNELLHSLDEDIERLSDRELPESGRRSA